MRNDRRHAGSCKIINKHTKRVNLLVLTTVIHISYAAKILRVIASILISMSLKSCYLDAVFFLQIKTRTGFRCYNTIRNIIPTANSFGFFIIINTTEAVVISGF